MYNFQAASSDTKHVAAREKAAYERLLEKYEALNVAADEGVYQVAITTERGTITVPVAYEMGRNIAGLLVESHAEWVEQVEKYLNASMEAVGDEVRSERREKDARQSEYEQQTKENLQRIASRYEPAATPALAQQAAAAPVQQPAPRRQGRPKKAVAVELAGQAALVPMNGASSSAPGTVVSQPAM